MLDISASDYGTYYDLTIPEPDSPLTVDWGSCMARNVAKLTKAFTSTGTVPVGSMGTYEISMAPANFCLLPISKLYHAHFNTVWNTYDWTDYQFVGTGNNIVNTANAKFSVFRIDRINTGSCRLLIGTNEITTDLTPWVLLQYGA